MKLENKVPVLIACLGLAWMIPAASTAEKEEAGSPAGRAATTELRELLQTRYEIASRLLEIEESKLNEGRSTLMNVCEAARRVRDSAIERTADPSAQLTALAGYLAVTRRLEASINKVVEKGVAPASERDLARYLRLDAEIALLRVKSLRDKTP